MCIPREGWEGDREVGGGAIGASFLVLVLQECVYLVGHVVVVHTETNSKWNRYDFKAYTRKLNSKDRQS